MGNSSIILAKKRKCDEFYTLMSDIEAELQHYKDAFRGKVVYCNCDDPSASNFVKYFVSNFRALGLKRLVASCYKKQQIGFFEEMKYVPATWCAYEGKELQIFPLKGDGDFRSPECVELLKEADVVVTNPPFSLFREYMAQLVKYEKKFLIIGNKNAATYQDVFPLIKDGRIWFGMTRPKWFRMPEDYPLITKSVRIETDGEKYIDLGSVCWFTNMHDNRRNEWLALTKRYTPEEYPKYDNYDAINVDRTKDIPYDYDGVMGVPITFLEKWNPRQFEILGITDRQSSLWKTKKYRRQDTEKYNDNNARGVIKTGNGYVHKYVRILIRHIKR